MSGTAKYQREYRARKKQEAEARAKRIVSVESSLAGSPAYQAAKALEKSVKELGKQRIVKLATDSAIPTRKVQAFTRLTEKAYSPLVIRKITKYGFPLYVGIISDDNLDTLDQVILQFMGDNIDIWKSDSIQDKRNLAGGLCEAITTAFGKTEGVAVTFMADKSYISSLFGDFMNHGQCKLEYYSLLNMSAHV